MADDNVRMTISTVTVAELMLPRMMTPFAKQLFAIPTHMTVNERLVLLQTALNLQPGFSIVEIGSYLGASTGFLALAALHRTGTVHAVDPWTNDAMGAEGEWDTWGDFRRNTATFEHYIVPHRGKSADIHAADGPFECDMLFIDGDHEYRSVVTDLQTWLPSLRPGGTLAMHDIDSPDVRSAYDDVLGDGNLQGPPAIIDRLLICQPRQFSRAGA